MKPVQDISCLVIDNGGHFEFAAKLAQTYRRVYYCPEWKEQYPSMNRAEIGSKWDKSSKPGEALIRGPKLGMDGVWLCRSWADVFDEVDLVCTPDIYMGAAADYWRRHGKPVWGAGRGEALELNRGGVKDLLTKLELPVNDFKIIQGLTKLRKFLEGHDFEGWHIKISAWRGMCESFKSEDFVELEGEMLHELHGWADYVVFLVEKRLKDRVELGMDLYTMDGQFPELCLGGPEVKDEVFVGIIKPRKEFPAPLNRVNDALSQTMRDLGYRGAFSTECRIGKDLEPYLIDFTARLPSPPGELYLEMYANLAEIVWSVANGKMLDPEPAAKYGAQARILSPWSAEKNWSRVLFPSKYRKHIKLCDAVQIDGEYWIIPQALGSKEVGSVVAWNDDLDKAIAEVKKIAKEVTGYSLDIPVEAFDKADEELEAAKKMGVPIF